MNRTVVIIAAIGAGLLALVLLPDHAALGWFAACAALFALSDQVKQR